MSHRLSKVFLTSLLVLVSGYAQAGETVNGRLGYRAYFGGLAAADMMTIVTLTPLNYRVSTNSRSTGFLDYLLPFTSRTFGRGSVIDPKNGDRGFILDSVFRGKWQEIRLEYSGGGAPRVSINPAIPIEDRDPVPHNLRSATFDPISAFITIALQKDAGSVCSGTLPVFNGKTRADITLSHTGHEALKANNYSVFSGPAEKCEARYRTLAGGYKKSWLRRDEPPPVIHFWIAPIGPLGSWAPVRLQAEIARASIVVHLTQATTGNVNRLGLQRKSSVRGGSLINRDNTTNAIMGAK
ncbi:MAG: hypothetical protein CMM47_05795 [Rhodospirillaceae bacterium]|nr:hypothetical protein [Rhodospirillaceae bacterium]